MDGSLSKNTQTSNLIQLILCKQSAPPTLRIPTKTCIISAPSARPGTLDSSQSPTAVISFVRHVPLLTSRPRQITSRRPSACSKDVKLLLISLFPSTDCQIPRQCKSLRNTSDSSFCNKTKITLVVDVEIVQGCSTSKTGNARSAIHLTVLCAWRWPMKGSVSRILRVSN